MGLYERIVGTEPDRAGLPTKISPHSFMAVLQENIRGQLSNPQSVSAFVPPLNAGEIVEATAIKNRIIATTLTRAELHDVLLLAEAFIPPYDTRAGVATRLGF